MSEKNEYEKFADNCYDNNINLVEAMTTEIRYIISRSNAGHRTPKIAAEKIMRLVLATKYEW